MPRVTKIWCDPNQELALVRIPKQEDSGEMETYIINKNKPTQRELINSEQNVSTSTDKLFIRFGPSTDSKTFFFIFNNELYKIEGASAIKLVSFPPYAQVKNGYILLILSDDKVEFYSFYTESNAKTTTTNHKYLGYIESKYIPYYFNNGGAHYDTFALKLTFINDYYFVDYNYDMANFMERHEELVIIRFNLQNLQTYIVSNDSKPVQDASKNPSGLPKYFISPFGLFDVFNFEFINLEKMFEILGKNYMDSFYEIFSTPIGRKFLFVSKKFIDFSAFESSNYSHEYHYGATVQGMLYDITGEEFILPALKRKNSGKSWINFFIYDSGIPHVFEVNSNTAKDEQRKYGVLFLDTRKHKFSRFVTNGLPIFISHLYVKQYPVKKPSDIVRKRIIFATLKTNKKYIPSQETTSEEQEITANDGFFVIDDELRLIVRDNYAIFEAAVAHKFSVPLQRERLRIAFDSSNTKSADNNIALLSSTNSKGHIFHLLQNDGLIIKSYNGEFGEFVLAFLDEDFEIDYNLSFFTYRLFEITNNLYASTYFDRKNIKKEPFIKVICRRNDFENKTYIINPSTRQVFEYEDFIAYVVKEFSVSF